MGLNRRFPSKNEGKNQGIKWALMGEVILINRDHHPRCASETRHGPDVVESQRNVTSSHLTRTCRARISIILGKIFILRICQNL